MITIKTYAPRQLNKVFIIQHCLPLASSWWFDLNTWLFLGLWNLTLFFPENLFHGNAFFFRRHLWFCWWSKSPVSRQLKAYVHPSGFSHMCILFSNTPFVKFSVLIRQSVCFWLYKHWRWKFSTTRNHFSGIQGSQSRLVVHEPLISSI